MGDKASQKTRIYTQGRNSSGKHTLAKIQEAIAHVSRYLSRSPFGDLKTYFFSILSKVVTDYIVYPKGLRLYIPFPGVEPELEIMGVRRCSCCCRRVLSDA